ncbi:MAG: alpha/beta hydrolase [Geminicoccaceae bacterium]
MTLYREFTDQESLDRAYNPSAGEPRGLKNLAAWGDRSADVRKSGRFRRVAYGPTLAEGMNLHFPENRSRKAPVHLFIHGGYWRAFSADDHDFVARAFTDAGYLAGVIDYALCPHVTMDEIVRQVRAAIAWTYRHVEGEGGDPDRITISGHSAGGHLVGMAASTDWPGAYGLPADTIRAGVAISGLFDLGPFPYTYLQPKLQLTWDQVRRNSPVLAARPSPARLWMAVGGLESTEFHRQSTHFHGIWEETGNSGRCDILDDHDHFTILDAFADSAHDWHRQVLDFLQSD